MWIARANATFLATLKFKEISSQKIENEISTWNSRSFLFYDAALHVFNPIHMLYRSIPFELAKDKKFRNLTFRLYFTFNYWCSNLFQIICVLWPKSTIPPYNKYILNWLPINLKKFTARIFAKSSKSISFWILNKRPR